MLTLELSNIGGFQEREGNPGSKEESSTTGREATDGTLHVQSAAKETGHASLEDLGMQQIELLAAAVDTAILKVGFLHALTLKSYYSSACNFISGHE